LSDEGDQGKTLGNKIDFSQRQNRTMLTDLGSEKRVKIGDLISTHLGWIANLILLLFSENLEFEYVNLIQKNQNTTNKRIGNAGRFFDGIRF